LDALVRTRVQVAEQLGTRRAEAGAAMQMGHLVEVPGIVGLRLVTSPGGRGCRPDHGVPRLGWHGHLARLIVVTVMIPVPLPHSRGFSIRMSPRSRVSPGLT